MALHGQVLGVGGLVPKLYAALRHGRRIALLPEDNRRQVMDAPPALHASLDICLVATVAEAVQAAYGLPLPCARSREGRRSGRVLFKLWHPARDGEPEARRIRDGFGGGRTFGPPIKRGELL